VSRSPAGGTVERPSGAPCAGARPASPSGGRTKSPSARGWPASMPPSARPAAVRADDAGRDRRPALAADQDARRLRPARQPVHRVLSFKDRP
jgi:hypothetical protein